MQEVILQSKLKPSRFHFVRNLNSHATFPCSHLCKAVMNALREQSCAIFSIPRLQWQEQQVLPVTVRLKKPEIGWFLLSNQLVSDKWAPPVSSRLPCHPLSCGPVFPNIFSNVLGILNIISYYLSLIRFNFEKGQVRGRVDRTNQ